MLRPFEEAKEQQMMATLKALKVLGRRERGKEQGRSREGVENGLGLGYSMVAGHVMWQPGAELCRV